jgi:ABC-2 type transport system permease protein
MEKLPVLGCQLSESRKQLPGISSQLPEKKAKQFPTHNWQLATDNWLLLLIPRFLAVWNGLRRRERSGKIRAIILTTLIMLFWCGIFWFFYRTLDYFRTIPDLGLVLSQKLLGMVFLTFFAILLFSNVITSLSTFFLSRDLLLLIPAPVPPTRLFAAKFSETLVDSSWMVLLFSGPAFLAYGIVHGGGLTYYLMALLTVIPFLIIPAALGVTATLVLAYFLPAQRGKDMLLVFSTLFLSLLYLFFRMLQPEKLVNPEAFSDFLSFLAAMQTPSSPFLPSTWATETLLPFLGLKEGDALFSYLLLLSTALFLLVTGSSLANTLYPLGWSKAQEGQRRRGLRRWWDATVQGMASLFPSSLRVIVVKDLKTFFRDTGQWSQLFMLLALIVVYVYNFSVLPIGGGALRTFYLQNIISFFNLALAGFVIAAIAVRFIFPAISLEGKTFWVLKSAPVPLRRLWWSKFWVGLLPLLFLGELLVSITNYFLNVSTFMMVLSAVTLFFLSFGIVALGMAVGVAYPNFTAEHSAKIAASFGGVLYMVLSILFIGIVAVLEAWPVYVIMMSKLQHAPLSAAQWSGIISSFTLALSLALGVFSFSTHWGLSQLEEMEVSL